ncbi:hypothetical protein FB565_006551 [Actinoplanes lutulentus]|nr:hypothetical protein [Actinoplanes lutulentus]MBB2946783.1 hypothetical protein [Actinoplanes lutulentus]
MTGTSRLRTAGGTFTWALVIMVIAAWFFYMAAGSETAWMENLTDDGTGTAVATAAIVVPFLLVLLGVRLFLFRSARLAVVLGWAASLPLFLGLYLAARDAVYCLTCG